MLIIILHDELYIEGIKQGPFNTILPILRKWCMKISVI